MSSAQPYVEAFKPPAGEPEWLAMRRRAAMARFAALGFPTRKQEAWRFTDLRVLQGAPFPVALTPTKTNASDVARWQLGTASHRLVLIDGMFAPDLSAIGDLPKGVWLASAAKTLKERPELLQSAVPDTDARGAQPFAALNAALFRDGFVLALEAGATLDKPVEIIHLGRAKGHSFQLRNLVVLGESSRATLLETFVGSGWTNAVGVVTLGENATLAHAVLQDKAADAVHISQHRIEIGKAARYEGFALAVGARLSRLDIQTKLAGEGAHCTLDGAFLLKGSQESTVATFIDHAVPRGTTREYFKGVADGNAHGAFLGSIAVRPDAQKTDAQQLNKNLLLSPRASIDAKPELDILADDVKCAHGATVGDLDETAMFYLQSRGITADAARQMLVEAFAAEVVERIADVTLRGYFTAQVNRWLAGGAA